MRNIDNSQRGGAHVLIVIVLVVALVGALGFIFWQNFMQPKTVNETASKTTQASRKQGTEKDAQKATETDPNEGYAVLEDWGVRFKSTTDISWSKRV